MADRGLDPVVTAASRIDAILSLVAANEAGPGRIVTAAFPFVPADLGLPHFASTYLPADALNRVYKFLGYRSALAGATDVHSVQVSVDGKTRAGAETICDVYHETYRRLFEVFRVDYDVYLRTDAADHVDLTHSALDRLEADGYIRELPSDQLRCLQCSAAPPQRLTQRGSAPPSCPWCGSDRLTIEQATHLFLDLERQRCAITEGVALAEGARRWIENIMAQPIEPWCITRDNQVGMRLHRPVGDKTLYLWFESMVGYATLMRRLQAIGFPAEFEFRTFFGKNILYHHGLLWPAISRNGLGITNRMQVCMRGFSDTDCAWAEAYWGDHALRVYCLSKVPDDGRDFRLTEAEFLTFRTKIWSNKIDNLMTRLALQAIAPPGPIDVDPAWHHATVALILRMARLADEGGIRRITEEILRYIRYIGSYCVEQKILWSDEPRCRWHAFAIRRVCLVLLQLLAPGALSDRLSANDASLSTGPERRIDTLLASLMHR